MMNVVSDFVLTIDIHVHAAKLIVVAVGIHGVGDEILIAVGPSGEVRRGEVTQILHRYWVQTILGNDVAGKRRAFYLRALRDTGGWIIDGVVILVRGIALRHGQQVGEIALALSGCRDAGEIL